MFVENDIDPIISMGIGHKITNQEIKDFVKKQLGNDKSWALKGLIKIFEFQTKSEQEYESTHVYNKIGFTGTDGKILTSFAKQYINRNFLTPKQMTILYKKMPKYWMQIVKISNREKLEKMIRVYLAS